MGHRAAGYQKKVCVIDRGVHYEGGVRQGSGWGGTCVNVGCVPKKLMYFAAHHREMIHGSAATAASFGINVGNVTFDWATLKKNRDAYVNDLSQGFQDWPEVTLKQGFAKFVGPKKIEVRQDDGKVVTLTADHILIGVGGYPTPCDVPGGELTINSDGFFDLKEQPKKAAVFGAGYIAVEMAGILNALGTETHLFIRGDTALRHGYDPFITNILMSEMAKHGPRVIPQSEAAKFERAEDGTITFTLKNGTVHGGYDVVLWATGRTPATKGLNLESAGIQVRPTGHIVVDAFQNTNVPGIYALGDAAEDKWQLTPVAIAAGRRLADRLFGDCPSARIYYEFIPTVVFSHPSIGTIGMTQAHAEKTFGKENVTTREATFGSMLFGFNPNSANKVMTGLKLVLVGPQERVAGLHIIGPSADEILQGFAVAVRMGATLADFEATMAIHPTIGEEFVTFGGWGKMRDGRPRVPEPPKPILLQAPPSTPPAGPASSTPSSGAASPASPASNSNAFSLWSFCMGGVVFGVASIFASTLLKKRSSL